MHSLWPRAPSPRARSRKAGLSWAAESSLAATGCGGRRRRRLSTRLAIGGLIWRRRRASRRRFACVAGKPRVWKGNCHGVHERQLAISKKLFPEHCADDIGPSISTGRFRIRARLAATCAELSSISVRPIGTRDDRRTVRLLGPAGQLRAGRGTLCRLQFLAAVLLAAARNRPGIRLALPHPQRLGAAVPRYQNGMAALSRPGQSGIGRLSRP